MDDTAQWTLDELSELVAGALRVVDYQGQPSRRVREVPDRRTIRWYTTIGLLDRPAAMRGRTALYGRRHLTQLVAVKRLQALGRSLVQVQSELVGATDAALESIARIPAGLALSNGSVGAIAEEPVPNQAQAPTPTAGRIPAPAPDAAASPARSALRFWAAAPAGADASETQSETQRETQNDTDSDSDSDSDHDADTVTGAVSEDGTTSTTGTVSAGSAASAEAKQAAASVRPAVTTVPALRLGSGVTLLLGSAGRTPTDEDARLIDEAAQPLLDLLLRRGLDAPGSGREIR